MAQVYYGWDVKLQRPVAIKVIDARYRDNPAYAERFVREAQTIAKWRHEHIINIYYADDQDGLYYFAMEYIDGPDLGQLIAAHAAKGELMPLAEALRVGRAVTTALDYAHERGIIHRDVKPSNVMVAEDGRVVLTDFGLALDVQQGSLGEIFGSARYLAPEQARDSAAAVPQSDLYALGIMLYEMLTGVVPFDDPSPTAIAVQHMTALPPPPRDVNPDLNQKTEAVLLKALSKSPRLRFQTGRELIQALEQALSSDPAVAAKPLPLPEAALYMGTEIVQPVPPLPSPATSPSSRWPEQPPAPFLPERPVAAEPTASRGPNSLLLAAVGLSLIALISCVLFAFLFFFQRGSRSEAASGGAQLPPPPCHHLHRNTTTERHPAECVSNTYKFTYSDTHPHCYLSGCCSADVNSDAYPRSHGYADTHGCSSDRDSYAPCSNRYAYSGITHGYFHRICSNRYPCRRIANLHSRCRF